MSPYYGNNWGWEIRGGGLVGNASVVLTREGGREGEGEGEANRRGGEVRGQRRDKMMLETAWCKGEYLEILGPVLHYCMAYGGISYHIMEKEKGSGQGAGDRDVDLQATGYRVTDRCVCMVLDSRNTVHTVHNIVISSYYFILLFYLNISTGETNICDGKDGCLRQLGVGQKRLDARHAS